MNIQITGARFLSKPNQENYDPSANGGAGSVDVGVDYVVLTTITAPNLAYDPNNPTDADGNPVPQTVEQTLMVARYDVSSALIGGREIKHCSVPYDAAGPNATLQALVMALAAAEGLSPAAVDVNPITG